MDRVTSFEYISGNSPSKSNGSDDNDEPKSIECIMDNFKFKCVWQKNDMKIDDDEFGDQTLPNISLLLSTSFPSGIPSLPSQPKTESNDDNDELESIECIVDNFEFKCVWQKKEENMQLVNQFTNQLKIDEHGDQTLPNISLLLSSSIPSVTQSEKDMQVDEDNENACEEFLFVSSTPHSKDSSKIYCSSAKQRSDDLAMEEFNKISPIYSPMRRNKNILKRKRLQFRFGFEDLGFDKKVKILKV